MPSQSEDAARTAATLAAIQQFNDAFNRRDVEGVMAVMAPDCVLEHSSPPPDGQRHEGHAACRAALEDFFRHAPPAIYENEEVLVCGDRGILRWRSRWIDASGQPGQVRGVDVVRVRDGKVVEAFAYVKG